MYMYYIMIKLENKDPLEPISRFRYSKGSRMMNNVCGDNVCIEQYFLINLLCRKHIYYQTILVGRYFIWPFYEDNTWSYSSHVKDNINIVIWWVNAALQSSKHSQSNMVTFYSWAQSDHLMIRGIPLYDIQYFCLL